MDRSFLAMALFFLSITSSTHAFGIPSAIGYQPLDMKRASLNRFAHTPCNSLCCAKLSRASMQLQGKHLHLQKVSFLLNIPYEIAIALTFENSSRQRQTQTLQSRKNPQLCRLLASQAHARPAERDACWCKQVDFTTCLEKTKHVDAPQR